MQPFINIHTHKHQREDIYIFNSSTPEEDIEGKFLSAGLHPWNIAKADLDEQIENLKEYCINKKLVAIGEIGLDRSIQTPLDIQTEVFKRQLDISREFNLPAIIHCVRAWSDILSIRNSGKYTNAWIFHGFTGSLETARQIIHAGCYVSFGKALFKNTKLQEVLKKLNLQNVFFETDDSDCKIEEVYQKASEILDICIDELKEIIFENFNKVF